MTHDKEQLTDLEKHAELEQSRDARPSDQLPDDINRSFERMEKLLSQIHGALDANVRESEHREFSSWRLGAYFIQILVLSLIVLALLDWILQGPVAELFVKLAFAGVLQLCAITVFLLTHTKT